MPREVLNGSYSDLGDVYALGVVALEVLTGLDPSPVAGRQDDIVTHLEDACEGAPDSMKQHLDPVWAADNEAWKVVSLLAAKCLQNKSKRPKAAEVLQRIKLGCTQALQQRPALGAGSEMVSECVICCDAPSCMALVPCGHRCLCEACSDVFLRSGQDCPMCRSRPEQLIRVYD